MENLQQFSITELRERGEMISYNINFNLQEQDEIMRDIKVFKNLIAKIEDDEVARYENIRDLGNYTRMITALLERLDENLEKKEKLLQEKLDIIQENKRRGEVN